MQPPSSMTDNVIVVALFDDISAFLNVVPSMVQVTLDSPAPHFSAEEVEEAWSIVAQLLKSSVYSTIDNRLINKFGGAIAVFSAEHRMPALPSKFLQLPNKTSTLHNTPFKSNKNIQIARSKSKKKLLLEKKMREDLQ